MKNSASASGLHVYAQIHTCVFIPKYLCMHIDTHTFKREKKSYFFIYYFDNFWLSVEMAHTIMGTFLFIMSFNLASVFFVLPSHLKIELALMFCVACM